MKKLIMLFVAIVMVAGLSANVMAQTATADAGAKIVVATTITNDVGLHFGTMSVPGVESTVILSHLNERTSTGDVILLPGTPLSTAAHFNTTGPSGGTYQITLPESATIANVTAAGNMTVNNFTCSAADPAAATFNVTATTGEFTVGATLNLVISQTAGLYEGTFDVTVTTN